MAYFANSSEGMGYQTKYCSKCIHDGDCAVWDLHTLYSYDLCNEEGTPGKDILDTLIPMDKKTFFAKQCTMFKEVLE